MSAGESVTLAEAKHRQRQTVGAYHETLERLSLHDRLVIHAYTQAVAAEAAARRVETNEARAALTGEPTQ